MVREFFQEFEQWNGHGQSVDSPPIPFTHLLLRRFKFFEINIQNEIPGIATTGINLVHEGVEGLPFIQIRVIGNNNDLSLSKGRRQTLGVVLEVHLGRLGVRLALFPSLTKTPPQARHDQCVIVGEFTNVTNLLARVRILTFAQNVGYPLFGIGEYAPHVVFGAAR